MNKGQTRMPLHVPVELGARSYDIFIGPGLLAGLGERIVTRFGPVKVGIITDSHVAGLYLGALQSALKSAGLESQAFIVPPGEQSKSLATFSQVIEQVLAAQLARSDVIIALGGGVVGDLAGFVAASARRGLCFVQVPTTLLAQVDSAVGGKTGVNSQHGKNLIGAFYQPNLVLADTDTLDTLPERELRAGYAEMVKYGLIDDVSFFEWLEANYQNILGSRDISSRAQAIAASCRSKANIVSLDERESAFRAVLNFGHTFAHALEGASGYSQRLIHGEAVAIGLALAHRFSVHLKLCPPEDAKRVISHLSAAGLPTRIKDIPGPPLAAETLMHFMMQDKKVKDGALFFILSCGLGRAVKIRDAPYEQVSAFLKKAVTY